MEYIWYSLLEEIQQWINRKKYLSLRLTLSKLLENNVIGLKDVRIKTENPTNARIFNVLFKKA